MEAVDPCTECLGSQTQTQVLTSVESDLPVLRLRLERPRTQRHVAWDEGTVDNEHMGKKKSKCCCIYRKPVAFGESSSEDDEDCENCFGHPEKRRKNRKDTQEKPADNCSIDPEKDQSKSGAFGEEKNG